MPEAGSKLRIGLVGVGRMGQAIMRLTVRADDLHLVGVCVRPGNADAARKASADAGLTSALQIVTDVAELAGMADVLIDFSLPMATPAVLEAALAARRPLVSGVTGLNPDTIAAIREASTEIPLLYDRNMSIGIAVMQKLLQLAATSLGSNFNASVAEIHHQHKVDAPSGTALKLGETVAKSRGQEFAKVYHYDPDGSRGKPSASDIAFHVSRLGEHPGEHVVRFASDMESLELKHEVTDRQVFANGALRAARWLARRPPGLYSVADIVERTEYAD